MSHVLGVYWAPAHSRPSDEDYIRALQPPFVRILDPDVAQIARAHQLAPNAVILPRNWQIDDSNKQATRDLMIDPVAAGRMWADRYLVWISGLEQQARERSLRFPSRDQMMFCAANEPNEGGAHPQIAASSLSFLQRMTEHGLRGLAVVFGPGHPNPLPVEDTWRTHYDAVMRYIQASQATPVKHALEGHEYWRKEGPHYHEPGRTDSDWTWLAGRLLRLPYDVPIVVGECGVEGKIYGVDTGRHTGWLSYNIAPEAYAQQIQDYIRGLDPRVKGVLPYLTDYRDNQWQSFDTHTAHGALLARRQMMVPSGQPLTQHTTHIPVVVGPGPQPPTPQPEPVEPTPNARRIDPRVMEAIMMVEAGRRTHDTEGRAIIRFEAHIFRQQLGEDALWSRHFRVGTPAWHDQEWRPTADGEWRRIHTGRQADQYAVLDFAQRLNREAAYRSISVGAPQIMGFNHARVGYGSAQLMWQAFTDSAGAQMVAMCNFVLTDPALHAAINARDWPEIGRRYNGASSAGELYRQAYVRLWGA